MGVTPSPCCNVVRNESDSPCMGHLKQSCSGRTLRVVSPQFEIFSQGESPHTVCFICNGLVKLTRTEADGTRAIVGLRRLGWLLGAAAILPGLPYASTAETVTRSQLCFVPVEQFKQAMETDAQFSHWVSTILASGVYSGVVSISEQGCLSGRQRLEKFLLEIIQGQPNLNTGKAVKIPIPLKNWEVAQLLALTPVHLSRLIRQMEKEGVIERKNGWLILPATKRLLHPSKAPPGVSESK